MLIFFSTTFVAGCKTNRFIVNCLIYFFILPVINQLIIKPTKPCFLMNSPGFFPECKSNCLPPQRQLYFYMLSALFLRTFCAFLPADGKDSRTQPSAKTFLSLLPAPFVNFLWITSTGGLYKPLLFLKVFLNVLTMRWISLDIRVLLGALACILGGSTAVLFLYSLFINSKLNGGSLI